MSKAQSTSEGELRLMKESIGGACGVVGYPQIGIIEVTGMAERDMCYSLTLCVKFLGWSGGVVMLGSVS